MFLDAPTYDNAFLDDILSARLRSIILSGPPDFFKFLDDDGLLCDDLLELVHLAPVLDQVRCPLGFDWPLPALDEPGFPLGEGAGIDVVLAAQVGHLDVGLQEL